MNERIRQMPLVDTNGQSVLDSLDERSRDESIEKIEKLPKPKKDNNKSKPQNTTPTGVFTDEEIAEIEENNGDLEWWQK